MRVTLGTKPSVELGFLHYYGVFIDSKKHYTLSEQIQKLRDHGVVISGDDFAGRVLQKVSYYRLSGYMFSTEILLIVMKWKRDSV